MMQAKPMIAILARLGAPLLVMLGVASLVFLLIHLVPGDPVEMMLGETAGPADRETLRTALGLNQPLWQQYAMFLKGVVQLDFGHSFYTQRPVIDMIAERLPATVELAVAALLVAVVIAFPLGILAAVRKDTAIDRAAMGFSLLGVSIPNFWMGPVLIMLFSIWLG